MFPAPAAPSRLKDIKGLAGAMSAPWPVCTNRCQHPWNELSAASSGTTTKTYLSRHKTLFQVAGIRLAYANHYTKDGATYSDTPGPNNIDVKASVVLPDGSTRYPIRFQGRRTVTIEPGGTVVSDPLFVPLAAADILQVYTGVTLTDSQKNPLGLSGYGSAGATVYADGGGGGEGVESTDVVDSGAVTPGWVNLYAPSAIYGMNTAPGRTWVALIGDSILHGGTDWPPKWGFASRLCDAAGIGYVRLPVGSSMASHYKAYAATLLRSRLVAGCGAIVLNLGTNDIAASHSLATVKADLLLVWALLARFGVPVFHCTLVPRTTSTDGWVTAANQTPTAQESVRTDLNDWLRAGSLANLAGIIEVADLVETNAAGVLTRNGGRFLVGATLETHTCEASTDATHVYRTGALSAIENYAIAAQGQTKLISGRGSNVYNTATFSPAPSSGDTYSLVKVPTSDGIHPARFAHETIYAGLDWTWLKRY